MDPLQCARTIAAGMETGRGRTNSAKWCERLVSKCFFFSHWSVPPILTVAPHVSTDGAPWVHWRQAGEPKTLSWKPRSTPEQMRHALGTNCSSLYKVVRIRTPWLSTERKATFVGPSRSGGEAQTLNNPKPQTLDPKP